MKIAERASGAATGSAVSLPGNRRRTLFAYAAVVTLAVVVGQALLAWGQRLPDPLGAGETVAPRRFSGAVSEEVVGKLLLATVVIVAVARAMGWLFRRIHQPPVVGEILAGILLGPSVLGAVWPSATDALFTPTLLPFVDVLAQVGLIFFMFLVGLEFDARLLQGRSHAAGLVSHVSIILPFLLGLVLALALYGRFGSRSLGFTPFALFLGTSMSVTAFPVLARILNETGLRSTRLGTMTLVCAAVDDVSAWCLLAVVVAVARADGAASAFPTIGLSVLFIAGMVTVVRPMLARLVAAHGSQGSLGRGVLALLFIGVLLSALATDRIGIHAIFGAFLFGAIMPHSSETVAELLGKLEDFTVLLLLPLFFALTGLRTEIGLIGRDAELWAICLLVIVVAVVGKVGGSALAGWLTGLPRREALALGVLMNTRGLVELVVLNIGFDLGVIPPTLFAMLVLMALITTFMTMPGLVLVRALETGLGRRRSEWTTTAGSPPA